MDIKEIKKQDVSEIYDFLEVLQDYGHIYHYPPEKLDDPFKKIMEGMQEIQQLMKDSFEM
jgi:molecular chaperone GrpE (heat shock protein)